MTICSSVGCDRPLLARGLCSAHYERLRRGKPVDGPIGWRYTVPPLAERLWPRVAIVYDLDSCWLWTGSRQSTGYGVLLRTGKKWLAHRAAWETIYGPIPDGMVVMHRCDRPLCVRPSHLVLGTQADNIADMRAKGRAVDWSHPRLRRSGEDVYSAKLSEAAAALIREEYAAGRADQYALAARFGVGQSTISRVIHGVVWTRGLTEDERRRLAARRRAS